MQPLTIDDIQKEVATANANPDLIRIYANGFSSIIGVGDISIILKQNDKSISVLNMSYTVAKTLAITLGTLIADFEGKTGNSIMVMEQVQRAFSPEKPKQ